MKEKIDLAGQYYHDLGKTIVGLQKQVKRKSIIVGRGRRERKEAAPTAICRVRLAWWHFVLAFQNQIKIQ